LPARRPAQLPASSAAKSGPAGDTKPTAPSITGGLRPSVVQSQPGSGPAAPPAARSAAPVSGPDVAQGGSKLPPPTAHVSTRPLSALPGGPGTPPADATTQIGARPGSNPSGARPAGANPVSGSASVRGAAGAAAVGGAAGTTAFGVPGAATAPGAGGAAPSARTQVGEAVRNVRATVAAAASRGPRRARLQLKKIDPWSVMKFSFAVSLVLFIVSVVATALLYSVLDALKVFESLNQTISQLTVSADQNAGSGDEFAITAKLVIGSAALLGAVNMVLFTALATLGAFIYNVCADLVGGIEVTLAERD
jgi:hypothetical protein